MTESQNHSTTKLLACRVIVTLQSAGFTAYWAGGCVRDKLLGRVPRDYDVATDARPDDVMALFPRSAAVGKAFGVVVVRLEDTPFEVATFREDHDYRDGRHPDSVAFCDAETDAARRDFTVNALFYDPATSRVLDYVEGQADIEGKVIRCVGDASERFREDHLRMLRAVRFASTLDFSITQETADAIRHDAQLIQKISPERIRDELVRTFCEAAKAGDALLLLDELGLLKLVLPEVSAMKGQEQPPEYHPEGDVFTHTVIMLNLLPSPCDPILALAVLLHDVGKPPTAFLDEQRWRFNAHASVGGDMAERILRRLRLPSATVDAVSACVRGHMRFLDVPRMKRSTLRRLVGRPTFDTELELHRLDCEGSHRDLGHHAFLVGLCKEFASEPVLPDPWVTGRDLMEMGVDEGPEIGKWKKTAYDAQLEEQFPDKEALLDWLRGRILREATRQPPDHH
ncbi:MAG: CCA tRNA nucleotidyltransferase [Kiritimatiellia bacterium]|nr:CCA tRNA nucleotidyltransferase [Kiritimatiellia bacterium]